MYYCVSQLFLLHHLVCFRVNWSINYISLLIISLELKNRHFFENLHSPKWAKKSLTDVQRAQIVILHKEGVFERQIAARLNVSKTGVHQAIIKHVSEGIFCDRKRSGRPRKTSIHDDNLIRRMAVRSPTSSTKKLQAALL